MIRRALVCVWVLFFLVGLWSPAVAAETASKSGKAPAVEAKPKDPQAQRKNEEEVYQLQKLLVDTLDQVQRNYVKEVDRRKLVEAAIKGVLSELDPYSTYISPDELRQFESSVESEFGGIGITISTDDGQLRVLSPLAGTPAYRAGMIAGDAIVEIDGKSTADLSLDDAVKQLKGEVGSHVTLVVIHPGQSERKTVTLTREVVHVPTVLGDRRKEDDCWDFLYDHAKKIGYVRITGFSRDTGEELKRALQELTGEGVKAMILDLRFNPGGLFELGHRSQRPVCLRGPDRQHQGPQQRGTGLERPQGRLLRRLPPGRAGKPLLGLGQRDRLGLPPRPSPGGDHGRADLGQGERAERDSAGREPKRAEAHHGRL